MKAIARSERRPFLAVAGLALLLLSSCAAPPAPIRPPAPAPEPAPEPSPVPPPVPVAQDWRDIMPPPGTWRWSAASGRSTAQYVGTDGTLLASMSCDTAKGQVLLARAGTASGPVAMGVTTSSEGNHPLLSDPQAGSPGWIVAAIPARDKLLDAMAFSRGRFLVDVAGLSSLALPSWPEVSRVIEDCR